MSDKDKNPDFTLDIEDEIEFDDSIFEADEDEEKKDEEKEQINDVFSENKDENDAFNDLLTEEELENLIIGIDEENDILDIPDEEEVLEELKFLDESFAISNDVKAEAPIEEEKKNVKKPKKEKAPKKEKKPREPFDFQFFIAKHKFKLLGAFLVFVIGIFVLTFLLVLHKNPKIVESKTPTTTKKEINPKEENQVVNSIEQVASTEEDKEIEALKEELNTVKNDEDKINIQKRIIDLETKKVEKNNENKMSDLKKYFSTNLTNLKGSIFKSEEGILVVVFIAQTNNYEDELYKAVSKTFEDSYKIDKVSFSIISQGENFNKIGELTLDINKFKEANTKGKTVSEKLKLMNYQVRK